MGLLVYACTRASCGWQQNVFTKGQALTVGAHRRGVVWRQTLAAPESPSKAAIDPSGDLESMRHISVTSGLVTLSSGCKRSLVSEEVPNIAP